MISSIRHAVFIRSWRRLYFRESFSVRVYFSKKNITIWTQKIFASWPQSILVMMIAHNCLRLFSLIKRLISSLVHISYVLSNSKYTCPTPGCPCICGIRYDLSGDFSLQLPKVLPIVCFPKAFIFSYLLGEGVRALSLVKSDLFPKPM